MFPLGTVLVPRAVLPLHVFEERYRALMRAVIDGNGEFGVVLIERGSEVGGGDTRCSYGTVARLVEAEELPDGRWAVIAVGERRMRVKEWLPDDPYPMALIEDWPDEHDGRPDLDRLYETVTATLRTALGLAGEVGWSVAPVDSILPDDAGAGSFAVLALAPLGPMDCHRLLGAEGSRTRLEQLETALVDQIEMLRAQLQIGNG